MNGYAGKILRINLTTKNISSLSTDLYAVWVGGHGMGSAIFWDIVIKEKAVDLSAIDGFHEDNVVTLMTSPLSGTSAPGVSARTEAQAIGVQSYPIGWFTRSNFGGRFAAMLKYAGWDGIVIEGKSETPVWIDIRDDTVEINDGSSLWGMDTFECQKRIWDHVSDNQGYGKWIEPIGARGRTTQRPAVVAIGPAGENLSRIACLIHDASNASGQCGFGAVWGSKKLKAISVIGTGSIDINDPKGLLQARLSQIKDYAFDLNTIKRATYPGVLYPSYKFPGSPVPLEFWGATSTISRRTGGQRPQACAGCHSGCRARYENGLGNEASCATTLFYPNAHSNEIQYQASDLLNKYGLNAFEMFRGLWYLIVLNKIGALGPGKTIDCPLNFDDYGSLEFVEQLVKMIAFRNDGLGNECEFGDTLAEGFFRAAMKWGRLEGNWGDSKTGILLYAYWGLPDHKEPRVKLEWGYGSVLGDRDINEHCFEIEPGIQLLMPAERAVTIITDKMVPYEGDQLMLDFSNENMYSEHIAKLVSWHRHYTRFWKESVLYCDARWPDFINFRAIDYIGSTGEAEPKFLNVVTGKDIAFVDGIEIGRKIWNLDQAIWTLQGRHRDMVHFSDYIYDTPLATSPLVAIVRDNGEWKYIKPGDPLNRSIDREQFEEFKTRFYNLEGWDPTTGYPTGSTLESLGLGYVADELNEKRKLGRE
jgi:aldehyde:ferredoxin oxidoreductase